MSSNTPPTDASDSQANLAEKCSALQEMLKLQSDWIRMNRPAPVEPSVPLPAGTTLADFTEPIPLTRRQKDQMRNRRRAERSDNRQRADKARKTSDSARKTSDSARKTSDGRSRRSETYLSRVLNENFWNSLPSIEGAPLTSSTTSAARTNVQIHDPNSELHTHHDYTHFLPRNPSFMPYPEIPQPVIWNESMPLNPDAEHQTRRVNSEILPAEFVLADFTVRNPLTSQQRDRLNNLREEVQAREVSDGRFGPPTIHQSTVYHDNLRSSFPRNEGALFTSSTTSTTRTDVQFHDPNSQWHVHQHDNTNFLLRNSPFMSFPEIPQRPPWNESMLLNPDAECERRSALVLEYVAEIEKYTKKIRELLPADNNQY